MRNLSSTGDYAGGHGARPDSGQAGRTAKAQFETTVNRPDRFGSGGGFST
jgi:hypothetical protein